jgi:tetratricopeptide (TPR) repeat protein
MGHYGEEFGLSFSVADRVLIAGRAIWFYAGKVLWPAKLTFSYPHWNIDPRSPVQYLWPLAAAATVLALFLVRRRLDKRVLIGLIFFVVTVSPLLGFIQIYTFRYAFVADHYVYFADLGLLALIAAGIAKVASRANQRMIWITSAVILTVLSSLTWRQSYAYESAESLLKDTIAKNPGSWMSYANLGYSYMEHGKTDEAIDCFRQAIKLNPSSFEAINNLGLALSAKGKLDEAIEQYQHALQLNPKDFSAYNNLGLALAAKGRIAEAIVEYQKAIDLDPGFVRAHLNKAAALVQANRAPDAVAEYKAALSLQPDNLEALNDLAWLRSTHPDASVRDGAEAVQLAERACELLQYSQAEPLLTLAVAYAEAGRFNEAVAAASKAEVLARAAGTLKLADKARELVILFSSGPPMRVEPEKGAVEHLPK